ncbi:replication protein P [Pontibacter sp. JAM-7]|uniref:replication protein P n=1 Tax=Pontibacter sp. JAM-7 TaxID=3366581 RepID=UPI003AF8A6C5
MKTPAKILGKTENGLPKPSWTSETPTGKSEKSASATLSVEIKSLVNMIFARFMAIYGHKFKSCFETQDEIRIAKREWAMSLQGYSEAELVAAVDQCKLQYAWMPTIAEFVGVLRDLTGDCGLPPVLQAYQEAGRFADAPSSHRWSHPAVYHAGKLTGWFRLRTEPDIRIMPDFRYQYDRICQRVRAGESLDIPRVEGLPDQQDQSLFSFIQTWGEQHGIAPEIASKWLFYLTKPKGSQVRARYRQQAQKQADQQGITLPDDFR